MSIEFRCHQCGKLLRTPDESAGKQARCPECNTVMPIPMPGSATMPESSPMQSPEQVGNYPPYPSPSPSAAGEANPYQAPALSTPWGREELAPGEALMPTRLDVGDALSQGWAMVRGERFGLAIGVCVLSMAINYGMQFGNSLVVIPLLNQAGNQLVSAMVQLFMAIAINAVAIWLNAGQLRFFTRAVRGRPVELGDLFAGGPYFWRLIGATLLLGIIFVGLVIACAVPIGIIAAVLKDKSAAFIAGGAALLLVIPFTILMLALSQFQFLIVDRNAGVVESLQLSRKITAGNRLSLFLLYIVLGLINLAGAMACLIGLIFTVPYSFIVLAVAYLMMSGAYAHRYDTPV